MLSALDDMLWHQLPTTFDHVGSSDFRFFDRVWFALCDPNGRRAAQYTLGVYTNMNVMDGAIAVVDEDRQHNLRVSRALRPTFDMRCGPMELRIIEPLKRFCLLTADEQHGLSAEIEWSAVEQPLEEAPHFHRQAGRAVEDYVRFNQIGKANGVIRAEHKQIEIKDWWACRDHSWGVRPKVGGIAEPESTSDKAKGDGFVFSFLFFSTESLAGCLQMRLDTDAGNYFSASMIDRTLGTPISITRFSIRAELIRGSTRFGALYVTLWPDGRKPLSIEIRQIANGIVMPGLGYSGGWNDRRGLGAWRGAYHREFEVWNIADPELVDTGLNKNWRPLHRIYPVSVVVSDGTKGTGSQTWLMTGEMPRLTSVGIDSEEK
jgi:hypothetical protein